MGTLKGVLFCGRMKNCLGEFDFLVVGRLIPKKAFSVKGLKMVVFVDGQRINREKSLVLLKYDIMNLW